MTRIAVVAGDGIGTEVVAQGLKVLGAVLPGVETTAYDLGAARYHRTGEVLPDSVLDELGGHDAILLGAVGDPSVPPGVLERGLLLKLRFDFDQYVNLRPSRLWPGTSSPLGTVKPGEIDLVVVREGTEGLYVGAGGNLHPDTPAEVATEESLNTRHGVERVIRDAFARASRRERRKVTLVHKTNVLTHAGGLWARTFDAVEAEFPDIETEYQHVDAAAMFLVTNPQRYDVVVTDNLFGDILTDIAAAVTGGIGLAASGSINPERRVPVDVRAGARLGAGHRRQGHRRPGRRHPLGEPAARPPRPPRRGAACRRRGRERALRPYPGTTITTEEVGDRIATVVG